MSLSKKALDPQCLGPGNHLYFSFSKPLYVCYIFWFYYVFYDLDAVRSSEGQTVFMCVGNL